MESEKVEFDLNGKRVTGAIYKKNKLTVLVHTARTANNESIPTIIKRHIKKHNVVFV